MDFVSIASLNFKDYLLILCTDNLYKMVSSVASLRYHVEFCILHAACPRCYEWLGSLYEIHSIFYTVLFFLNSAIQQWIFIHIRVQNLSLKHFHFPPKKCSFSTIFSPAARIYDTKMHCNYIVRNLSRCLKYSSRLWLATKFLLSVKTSHSFRFSWAHNFRFHN